jgi:beta-lactamase class A
MHIDRRPQSERQSGLTQHPHALSCHSSRRSAARRLRRGLSVVPAWAAIMMLLLSSPGLGMAGAIPTAGGDRLQLVQRPEDSVPILYSAAPDRPDPNLQDIVNDVIGDEPGTWGVVVKKLDTGQYASFGVDTQQVSASLYKLWVLSELYRQASTGDVSLDGPYGLRSLAASMIQWSSNDAAFSLVDILGPDNVNAEMQRLGLNDSFLDWSGIGDNITTPRDVAHLLELIATSRVVDTASSREMIGLMLGQQINDRLPQGLPAAVPFAHKTGDLDLLRHDAGIVYSPAGPYVIVCMSSDLSSYYTATLAQIELSQRVYNYFASSAGSPFRYFPQTKLSIGNGFFKFWNTQGSLPIFGYPLTPEVSQNGITVQWFERARLEWHPDLASGPASQFEPGVVLGLVGSERAAQLGLHWADSKDSGNGQYFVQTHQEITGNFLQYWREHGGRREFGYPISPAVNMVSPTDGKTYLTQWFERARFEWHPELPGGPGVVLGRLGAELLVSANPSRVR